MSERTVLKSKHVCIATFFISQFVYTWGFFQVPFYLPRRSCAISKQPAVHPGQLIETSLSSRPPELDQNSSNEVADILVSPRKPLRPPWLAKQESRRITNNLKQMLQSEPVRARAYFDALCLEGKADSFHYAVMVEGCSTVHAGRELLEQMQQASMPPHVVIYNSLLKKALKEQEGAKSALDIIEEMRGFGIEPNERTYTMLLDKYRSQGLVDACQRTFAEMQLHGLALEFPSWQDFMFVFDCKMSAIKLKTLLIEEGKVDDAFALFRTLVASNRTDAVICNTMLNACRTEEEADAVWEVLQSGSVAPTTSSFNTRLRLQCERGALEEARQTLQDAEHARCVDGRTYTRLIRALDMAGRTEEAAEVFVRSRRFGLNRDVSEYPEVLRRLDSSTRTKRLHELMQRNRQEGFRVFDELERNGSADVFAYNVAIENSEGADAASALFLRMRARGVPLSVVTWNILIKALVNEERISEAIARVEEMVRGGFVPCKRTLRPLIGALKRLDRQAELEKVMELKRLSTGGWEQWGPGPGWNEEGGAFRDRKGRTERDSGDKWRRREGGPRGWRRGDDGRDGRSMRGEGRVRWERGGGGQNEQKETRREESGNA